MPLSCNFFSASRNFWMSLDPESAASRDVCFSCNLSGSRLAFLKVLDALNVFASSAAILRLDTKLLATIGDDSALSSVVSESNSCGESRFDSSLFSMKKS
ncbi:hypothetical protein OGATHE_004301 [Ogataea polymorpha]|uniref:Uncharacterized protein n=1 Tax=Ogataea polymorpha TaxID=460523 RepID=A0A9P8P091_9ASCO|nr:hypothetical protein OGATHE_004301 [Ogataea polymorpha]